MDGLHQLTRLLLESQLLKRLPRDRRDGGYTTESVIVTALLAGLAITVIGIIAAKVIARANGLNV